MKKYKNINIILIEDEDFDIRRVKNTLSLFPDSFNLKDVVSDGNEALNLIKKDSERYDVVIMDYQIAGGIMGEELIKRIKEINFLLQVIVITKHTINITDFDFANNLLESGAFWYCTKYPGDIEEYIYQPTDFIISIFNAFEKKLLEKSRNKSNKKLSENILEILNRKRIIGNSDFSQALSKQIKKLSEMDVNVFITGPSGTGKELIANHIHFNSKRKFENFIPINCGSIPAELIESELFGYEKGAFTGADSKKAGLFELANNGTIFLDEVADLPLNAQVKLLRVLQEGEIEKLGRTKNIKVDVRVISATNKDIEKEVMEKRFREDLYYRLNVVPVRVLPLRDRKADILPLLEYYLDFYCTDFKLPIPELSEEVREYLISYPWNGNVRELKNFIQRILYFTEDKIDLEDIKSALKGAIYPVTVNNSVFSFLKNNKVIPLNDSLLLFKKKYFDYVRSLSNSDADAAKKMGIAPSNYHRMCKELGLK